MPFEGLIHAVVPGSQPQHSTLSGQTSFFNMSRDAMWLVLVMMLGASLLVVLIPEDEPVSVNQDDDEEALTEDST